MWAGVGSRIQAGWMVLIFALRQERSKMMKEQMRKISDLEKGQIFAIEGTRTYPKLKLYQGYIDIRDKIRKERPVQDFDVEVISKEELYKDFADRFQMPREAVDALLDQLAAT